MKMELMLLVATFGGVIVVGLKAFNNLSFLIPFRLHAMSSRAVDSYEKLFSKMQSQLVEINKVESRLASHLSTMPMSQSNKNKRERANQLLQLLQEAKRTQIILAELDINKEQILSKLRHWSEVAPQRIEPKTQQGS